MSLPLVASAVLALVCFLLVAPAVLVLVCFLLVASAPEPIPHSVNGGGRPAKELVPVTATSAQWA